jgi:hypothetical protein
MYVANLLSHARVAAMGPLIHGLVFFASMRTSVVTICNFCARRGKASHTYEQTNPNLISGGASSWLQAVSRELLVTSGGAT